MEWISFYIQHNDASKRVDSVCKKLLSKMPFSRLMKEIRKKHIRVNGTRTSANTTLHTGDTLTIAPFLREYCTIMPPRHIEYLSLSHKKHNSLSTTNRTEYSILYEKDGLCIIDKPAGVSLFPVSRRDSIAHFIKHTYAHQTSLSFTPAPCHQLDTGTSGVLINAYTADAARAVYALQTQNMLVKLYVAVLENTLKKERLTHALYRNTSTKKTYAVSMDASAISVPTVYKTMPLLGTASTYAQHLGTFTHKTIPLHLYALSFTGGKTHQLRAQCAAEHASLYGDVKYTTAPSNYTRRSNSFFLHAAGILQIGSTVDTTHAGTVPNCMYAPIPTQWHRIFSSQKARNLFTMWNTIMTECSSCKYKTIEAVISHLKKK